MNVGRLKEIVDLLLRLEEQYQIQNRLSEVHNALNNIIAQPQQPAFQQQFANAIEHLKTASYSILSGLQLPQKELIVEIGGDDYFLKNYGDIISTIARDNAITPAITANKIQSFLTLRQQYIDQIRNLSNSLRVIGVEALSIKEGEAEIGFLLPRPLFKDELDGLIKELTAVKNIIRAFSELTTGGGEPVTVRQISTSDPLFFFGLGVLTISQIGDAISWAVGVYKDIEEIRKLRAETAKIKAASTHPQAVEAFDTMMKATITDSVKAEIERLLSNAPAPPPRPEEQRAHLEWALNSILARVERGMTVEIRFLPPPSPQGDGQTPTPEAAAFDNLARVSEELSFPPAVGQPVLQIPDYRPRDPE